MMSVSHSLGGMYQSYYASRHPKEVKAAVFIDDANVCSLTAYFKMINTPPANDVDKYIAEILEVVRKNPMPVNIPLIDIVAVGHTDENGDMDTVWQNCHAQFVAASPERKLLLAYGVGHAIFVDNPTLVINAIITQYANYVVPKQKAILLERANTLALKMANENKKNEIKCGQSEDDLTTWGYSFLEKNETEKAIEVFKLNVLLNPEGWNTYDCLGEAYLKAGKKDLAILNYKKSLELNPKNENATKVLMELQK
ncbi:MAG: tetratricopeptide repeat protein [Bacteroidetes bacterium]|nr:tetratricopeptide repeat protein [Bacteroidota bacterium]